MPDAFPQLPGPIETDETRIAERERRNEAAAPAEEAPADEAAPAAETPVVEEEKKETLTTDDAPKDADFKEDNNK